jgi:aerobic-type carbon monoxide dehydrogenase small subunit (CoxS/CutS family)
MARILQLTLNGRARDDAISENVLLLDYLREIVGLTGTKTGCDGGECGACTVLVDDQPRLSCLTLAATIDGRRVDTIESLVSDGRLSAVQRGFHEKLGSQCGYCTPGFIMASAGLLAAQSATKRRRDPRGAWQQHLPLYRLCKDHRSGDLRGRTSRTPPDEPGIAVKRDERCPTHTIGDYVPLVDGPEKVSGRAKYTADFITPGMLAGRILRSPYSHAEILDVDVSEAVKLPGVKAVVTGADCDKGFGVLPIARTEHPLARDRVRYCGEPVAAVAAIDDATAKEALKRIVLKVRELPAYHTVRAAMAPDAIDLHERRPKNVERDVYFELGDVVKPPSLRRPGARGDLQLRRGLPEPDGDARGGRRLRCGARPHHRACLDAGALLRAPHAVANPRHGHVAHPRDQAICRRRLRLPHRNAQRRADRGAPGAQGRRLRAHNSQPRRDLHHPSRPA